MAALIAAQRDQHQIPHVPVGEPAAVSFGEHPAQCHMGGGFIGAGLSEQALLAGDRVGSGIDLDPERAAWQPLNMPLLDLAVPAR